MFKEEKHKRVIEKGLLEKVQFPCFTQIYSL